MNTENNMIDSNINDFIASDDLSRGDSHHDNTCCGETEHTKISKCEIFKTKNVDAELDCVARLLTVNVKVDDVCCKVNDKKAKVAIGVLLFKKEGEHHDERPFAFKGKIVKAEHHNEEEHHDSNPCSCIARAKFCFVIPTDFDDFEICKDLPIKIRVIAHYWLDNIDDDDD